MERDGDRVAVQFAADDVGAVGLVATARSQLDLAGGDGQADRVSRAATTASRLNASAS